MSHYIWHVAYMNQHYVTIAKSEPEARERAKHHFQYINGKEAPIPLMHIAMQEYPEELLVHVGTV